MEATSSTLDTHLIRRPVVGPLRSDAEVPRSIARCVQAARPEEIVALFASTNLSGCVPRSRRNRRQPSMPRLSARRLAWPRCGHARRNTQDARLAPAEGEHLAVVSKLD